MSFLNRSLLFICLIFLFTACVKNKTTTLAKETDPILKDKVSIEEVLETPLKEKEVVPHLPVYKLTKSKRMIAAQVLVFNCENMEELEKRISAIKDDGFNTIIFRVFQNKGDRYYKFAEAGSESGVYFKTDHAPIVDDILAEVTDIVHKFDMEIFAWITTRYANYGVEETKDWQAVSYDLKEKQYVKAKGLNLFNWDVKNHLLNLYQDLAAYNIDGVLFQDDLVLRHNEGFSVEAKKGFARHSGKIPTPDKFYEGIYEGDDGKFRATNYGNDFWQWSVWKNRKLLEIASEIRLEMKRSKPDLKFAINFMYEAALKPKDALAWLSQDLQKAVDENFDYYAIMAYHRQISKELNIEKNQLKNTMAQIVANSLKIVGDPKKMLIKLQIADWKNGKTISADEVADIIDIVKEEGGESIAFVPYRSSFDFSKISDFWRKEKQLYVKKTH